MFESEALIVTSMCGMTWDHKHSHMFGIVSRAILLCIVGENLYGPMIHTRMACQTTFEMLQRIV